MIAFVFSDNYITYYTLVMFHMISHCQKNNKVQLNSDCLEVSLSSLYLLLRDVKQVKIRVKLSEP